MIGPVESWPPKMPTPCFSGTCDNAEFGDKGVSAEGIKVTEHHPDCQVGRISSREPLK